MKRTSKKCKQCGNKYQPINSLQKVCSPKCAIDWSKEQRRKAFKAETRRLKQKIKTRSDWLKEAQTAFNAYIRHRDKDLPCISCNRYHQGQYHAGHYRTVGAHPELRFNELNCHKQCAPCNNHKSGNIVEYRINLVKRIGNKIDWLEGSHHAQNWSIDDIKDIKQYYKDKLKALQ